MSFNIIVWKRSMTDAIDVNLILTPTSDLPLPSSTALSTSVPTTSSVHWSKSRSSGLLSLPTALTEFVANTTTSYNFTIFYVHKQQFPLCSPYVHHRRHPSAPPAVVVQPTKVPGLPSLSKPVQRQLPSLPRHRPSPKSKQVQPSSSPSATPAPEAISVPKSSPEIWANKSLSANARGRLHSKPKEKFTTKFSKVIPVPRSFISVGTNLSRSEPSASNVRSRKDNPFAAGDPFSICDDLTDTEDDTDD
ncbi:hypothetical protein F5051DRAFT_444815 [Lentinula edodes]|nr:hypothetical protein F5051DRAFT_444815 [Lentinula edodes]